MAPVHIHSDLQVWTPVQDQKPLNELPLAKLRDRIMTEAEGKKLSKLLAEIASRLDLNVCLEDFHVAQQLFHVSGLNTRLQTIGKWTPQDAERMYWQKRRLYKALRRITNRNWREYHRCDEFCVDDCYFVCAVECEMCYKCVIQYPIYIAKYKRRSYFQNVWNLVKSVFTCTEEMPSRV